MKPVDCRNWKFKLIGNIQRIAINTALGTRHAEQKHGYCSPDRKYLHGHKTISERITNMTFVYQYFPGFSCGVAPIRSVSGYEPRSTPTKSVPQFVENRNQHSTSPVTNVMKEPLPENMTFALPVKNILYWVELLIVYITPNLIHILSQKHYFTHSNPIHLRFILILSSHLHRNLPNGLFPPYLVTKTV